jgi:hypothetical protein
MSGNPTDFDIDFDGDCVRVNIAQDIQREDKNMDAQTPGLNEPISCKGHVLAQLFDENGVLKEEREIDNLIVNTGLYWLAKKLAAESTNEMTHIAVGTSATATSASQTSLVGTESGRVAMTSKTRTNNQVVAVATFPAGVATATLNEAGIFDGSAGTTMFSRVVFGGAVTKGASDSFQITWTITLNAA